MGWGGYVLLAAFTIWLARRMGPRKGESYLGWLSLSLFVVAVPLVLDRLAARYGREWRLAVLGLLAAVCIGAMLVARARKTRREAR